MNTAWIRAPEANPIQLFSRKEGKLYWADHGLMKVDLQNMANLFEPSVVNWGGSLV
jgi:hypothetical protein